MMLNIGDAAPTFSLSTDTGETISSAALKGQRYVLYFYPKDDTSGCTVQACGMRDALSDFDSAGVKIFGVSADSVGSHQKFVKKFSLNFPLLSDPERQLIEAMGVWVEKSMYGKKYMGIVRATFVIDAKGKIEQVWPKVNTERHASELLSYLKGEAPVKAMVKKAPSKAVAKKAAAKKTTAKAP